MANGYKMDRGFLFDYSWEKQFRKLKPKDFYTLFWELYDYQKSGGDSFVDDHDNHVLMGSIVTFVVPQIKNRIIGSRRKKESEQGAGGTLPPIPPIDKLRENKLKEDKSESNAPAQEGSTQKNAYGEFANVFLTEEEYTSLMDQYGKSVAEGLIDNFSVKLKAKGYQYEDHYATILDWANKDGVKPQGEKSYDVDDFFQAALMRSYEILGGD